MITVGVTTTTKTLFIYKNGSGNGLVTSLPSGIYCGSICQANTVSPTLVTLTAAPDLGSTFTGWSGACAGSGTCIVTMDAAKSVTATFE